MLVDLAYAPVELVVVGGPRAAAADWEAWARQRASRRILSTAHAAGYNTAAADRAESAVSGLFSDEQHRAPAFRTVSQSLRIFRREYTDRSQFWATMGSTNLMASVQDALSNAIELLNGSIRRSNVAPETPDLAGTEELTATVDIYIYI